MLQLGCLAALLCLGLRYYPSLRALAATGSPHLQIVPQVLHSIVGGDDSHRARDNYEASGVPATSAELQGPAGLAIDSHGNLYVADSGYGIVRRVNASDGIITTVAGTDNPTQTAGTTPVPATQVQLIQPAALAIGPDDSLYIADPGNYTIYRVDTAGNMTLVAGTGTYGYSVDGTPAKSAQINYPMGLAVDSSGNVYFSEEFSHVVRRVGAADGLLTTVAGNQQLGQGFAGDGNAATAAQLNYPKGLALDAAGNLYIADSQNNVVRRVDAATKNISTFAGNHTGGSNGDGGPATSAQLSAPGAVALDAAGQVYISDSSNGLVRKVAADGTIMTVAGMASELSLGSGYGRPATATRLANPDGIALDASGNLYISDSSRVLKAGPDSALAFGTQNVGTTTKQMLTVYNPTAAPIALGSFSASGDGFSVAPAFPGGCSTGTMLQPGAYCSLVVTFAPQTNGSFSGSVTVNDGAGALNVALSASAVLPTPYVGLDIAPILIHAGESATLTAAVYGNGSTPTGSIVFTDDATGNTLATTSLDASGKATVTVSPANGVYAITANYSGDSKYAPASSDEYALTVQPRVATVALVASATTAGTGGTVSLSATVAADSGTPTGSVDFRIDGSVVATAPLAGGAAQAMVKAPTPGQHTLQAVYTGDAVYGTAFSNTLPLTTHGAVLQFSPGAAYTVAGIPSDDLHPGFAGDGGPALSARFHTPNGVAVDGAGNIFIADEQNNVIRKVTPGGTITTVAGIPYAGGINISRYGGDGGLATSAYFTNPAAVAVDSFGNLFIADYSNNVVRKVTAATGIITTIAGVRSQPGYNGDGAGTSTRLNNPIALALDAQGNLYIADYGNHLVRKLDSAGNLTTIAGSYYLSRNGNAVDGPATQVALNHPMGVAVSPTGELYIADADHNVIRKIDSSGKLVIVAGVTTYLPAAENVPATTSALNRPEQVAFDAGGNLYFADTGNNIVRKIDTTGIISTVIGYLGTPSAPYYYFNPLGAPSTTFQLVTPSGVAVDPAGGILVTDNFNQTILRSGTAGALVFGPSNGDSDPQVMTLTNSGDTALIFNATPYTVSSGYAVSLDGTSACNFSVGLAPGASCTVTVRNHAAAGTTGSLTFAANVAGTPTVQLKTNATAQPSTTMLYLSEDHGSVGDNVLLYGLVSVSGPPAGGTVGFYDGTTLLGSAQVANGLAYMYVSTLSAGTHSLTARYSGAGVYGASTSDPASLVLTGAATSTSLAVSSFSVSYGTNVTFTATVVANSAVVTSGTVTFFDGGTALGMVAVNASGVATLNTSSLGAGTHSITASYGASGSFASSTSAAVQVVVSGGGGSGGPQPDYTVTIDGLPAVIHRGESRVAAVTVQPLGGFSGAVQLSCGTLPDYASCSFSPATLVVMSGSSASSVLTITASPAPAGQSAAPLVLQQGGGLTVSPLRH